MVGLRSEEVQNGAVHSFWLVGAENVVGVWDHHEFRAGNTFRDNFAVSRRDEPVGFSVDDERGRRDLRETVVCFPGEDALQLSDVAFRARIPLLAKDKVLLDAFLRSA